MGKNRLEAFSDGVIAIIITIMVLELKVPHGPDLQALVPLIPTLLGYLLSFVYVGIYWNNHHHMLSAVEEVNGKILWANLHLLFWLSLIPFVTDWVGQNHLESVPVAAYGFVLLMCGVAYMLLERALVAHQGRGSPLAKAMGADRKGKASVVLYALGIPLSLFNAWLGIAAYVLVAGLWFLPDRRIENELSDTAD
jgi:uncharacterized membrane protein